MVGGLDGMSMRLVTVATLLGICLPGTAASGAYARDALGASQAAKPGTTYNVTYMPGTVVLDPAVVARTLKSVSAAGVTYRFAGTPSELDGLHAGNILLVGGKALRTVLSASSSGGETVVSTGSASLLQAIKNGEIGWNYDIPFGSTAAGSGVSLSVGAGLRRVQSASAPASRAADAADSLSRAGGPGKISYKGAIGGYDVDLNFDESSLAGLIVDVSAKKKDGSLAGYAGVNLSLFGLFKVSLGVKQLFQSQQWVVYKDGKKCD